MGICFHCSSGSPYYVSNQNAGATVQQAHVDGGGGGGGGVSALIALKRNHVLAVSHPAASTLHQQSQQQQQPHTEIIYEDVPTDYSGHMEAGEEECVGADATVSKRPKYVSEVL